GDRNATAPGPLTMGSWTHLAETYDGANLRFYVNGTLVTSTPMSGSMLVSGKALRIGGNRVWGEWFKGNIDDVRVYNRALSAGEIQSDMNTPVGDVVPPTLTVSAGPGGSILEGGGYQFNVSASGGSGT